MALKIRLDEQAERDLREIRDYLLREAGAQAANKVRRHLHARIKTLSRFPLIGIRTSHGAVRILPPVRYPYRIYYAVSDEAVVILHIRHTARRAPGADEMPGVP